MSLNSMTRPPVPRNETVLMYAPGSPEKIALKKALDDMLANPVDVPIVIGGKELRTGKTGTIHSPHDHSLVLGTFHQASAEHVDMAVAAAKKAWLAWSELPWEDRASVFIKAAELLATKYRPILNAATMLGQSKTCFQAEIDATCELVDFWRFNAWYMTAMYQGQPDFSVDGAWNRVEYRPLEGFVLAITPFNFTSIAGNLPTAPAMMGNVAIWKPASSSMLSAWYLMKLLKEAGLPDGVINMLPGAGRVIGEPLVKHPDLAGIHFTGSTGTFQHMWKTVGENIHRYKAYPRLVGETGGKDFIFAHPTSDVDALAAAAVRGSFEYQGQKCSAASRMYAPKSIWPELKSKIVDFVASIKMGNPLDFTNFMAAVIDENAFNNITEYIDYAKASPEASIIAGGEYDKSKGWFIQPTVVVTTNPKFRLMAEEIFGPVLTVYVYEDEKLDETLTLCDTTSPYALTGAIFARDRHALSYMEKRLRHTAGNFYLNDKPTGAVVGQQPFGGGRASGTNDKAGSMLNLMRWASMRTIKENFIPPKSIRYPHMDEE